MARQSAAKVRPRHTSQENVMTPTKAIAKKRKPARRELNSHTLVLRVEASLRDDIERIARAADKSLGETIRELLHEGLALAKQTKRAVS